MNQTDIELMRHDKDEFFRRHAHSPLEPDQKRGFTGLSYYDYNSQLAFEAQVKEYENKERVMMQTSTGGVQEYVKFGTFSFEVGGEPAELTLYAQAGGQHNSYFLPFTDATSGGETYSSGRYLDIEREPGGAFYVDFNLAYNPYCAYNLRWTCPIPPRENRLTVPIQAGEKKPSEEWATAAY